MSLSACAGDGPTAPVSPPVTPPPVQNPETPLPAPTLGALTIEIENAPPNATPMVVVRSGGVERVVTQSRTLDSLPPGDYQIVAAALVVDSVRWEAQPDTQIANVRAQQVAPRVFVRFKPIAASIVLRETGLPSYARATVRITGDNGIVRTALTRDTVQLLPAGTYTVVAEGVETTNGRFEAVPASTSIVLDQRSNSAVDFAFGPAKAGLTVSVDGLPGGVQAGIAVTGPSFSARVDATRTLGGLEPGIYRAAAGRVSGGGFSYDPNTSLLDASLNGTQQRTLAFSYRLATGGIAAIVGGLPSGANAAITVAGPAGFARAISGTQTLTDLAPGTYRFTASNVTHGGVSFAAQPASLEVVVTASMVAVPAEFQYGGAVGAIDFRVQGLPPSLNANVSFAGPGNRLYQAPASTVLTDLPAGAYTMSASSVTGPNDNWDPDITSRQVQVRVGDTVSAGVSYTPRTGTLAVSLVGLPEGVTGSVRITGPGGTDRTISESSVLSSMPVGNYTIAATSVVDGSTVYVPSPASTSASVTRGNSTTRTVSYGGTSTALTLDFSGLPGGLSPIAVVTGPGGYTKSVNTASVLENLTPGLYRVVTSPVSSSTATYAPTSATAEISVSAGARETRLVEYTLATGSLAVSVGGLPTGTVASVSVAGPNGFSTSVTGTYTLVKLAPGSYTITASNVVVGGVTYAASPASRTVTVEPTLTAAAAPVGYATSTGGLRVSIAGLPAAASGAVTIAGPSGEAMAFAQTSVTGGLAVGSWTVTGHEVTVSGDRYSPSPATRTISVLASDTVDAPVTFTRSSGRLTITVAGLPNGTSADIQVTGPAGYAQTVNTSQTLVGLDAGTYTITASDVVEGSTNYSSTVASQGVSVTSGGTATRTITYDGQTTALAITLSGVPSGATASLAVSGPGAYSENVSTSGSLTGLAAGSYTISAPRLTSGNYGYDGAPTSQSVTLATGETKSAIVTYSVSTGALKVTVSGLPGGVSAPITVTGPNSFSRTVTATQTIKDLPAGAYTIAASGTTSGATSFTPSSTSLNVTVTKGSTVSRTITYSSSSTSLSIDVEDVPSGASAAITVTGPGGFSQSVSGSTAFTALASGTYSVSASNVVSGGITYTPTPASQTATLTTGQQLTRTVTYAAASATLTVSVSGVPSGASGAITVTGPGGYSQSLTSSQTLTGLTPGTYTVAAASFDRNGYTYAGTPTNAVAALAAGDIVSRSVVYAASTARLSITVGGLPGSVNGQLTVTGPGGYSSDVSSTTTLSALTPGAYTISAGSVTSGSTLYSPSSSSQAVTLTAGATASRTVTYTGAGTSLDVSIGGLPGGVNAVVAVTGPGGFSQTLAGSTTLSNVAAGTYTLTANAISNGGYNYIGSPASQTRTVTTGQQQTASVAYTVATGRLTVNVSGLAGGTNAAITVSGPGGYSQQLSAGTTLQNLTPGTYTIASANVTSGSTLFTASPASQTAAVTAGSTLSRSVAYSGSGTSLALTVTGVPSGGSAAISVTGPAGYNQAVTATTTLSSLTSGTYTIASSSISHGGYTYTPTPASQTRSVTTGQQQTGSVAYAASTGRLTVTVGGLPGGASAALSVTGPGGFSQAVTGTTTLGSLTPGTYTVAASNVSSGGTTYAPATASQTATVSAGSTATKTVTYAVNGGAGGTDTDFTVEGAYVTQAIQNFDGTVPLVADRAALLRVFVTADAANTKQPTVRVRLYTAATNFRTFTINAPSGGVPTSVSEGTLNSSWNATLTESDMRVGLKIAVDVDPTNSVSEPDESDNVWPRTGTAALDVRTVAPYDVVFVPIYQSANGTTGNVTTSNLESTYISMTRRIMPLSDINASVRATYTTNAPALQSSDGNNAWLTVLSEMNALRVADNSASSYIGVVKVTYGGGVAGYAYVPGRAGVVWDKSSSAPGVTAHEIGHNFSRRHVAACGSGNTDSKYPYGGGQISLWGWNSTSNAIVGTSVTDIMGYCSTQWISDYTWTSVMNYRGPAPMVAGMMSGEQRSLMVWGRIRNGVVTLEPALRMVTRPVVADRPGAYRLELRDKNGGVLTGFTFNPEVIDHDENAEAFAFAVPMSLATEARLASIAIVGGANGTVVQTARVAMANIVGDSTSAPATLTADDGITAVTDPGATISRSGSSNRVTWDDRIWPLALVRDAQTGQVLAYLRTSGDAFIPGGAEVRISFSNGVQSVTRALSTR